MYTVIVATEPQGLSDRKGRAIHTCMSHESALGGHGRAELTSSER
jgi:hypothetical protein